MRPKVTLPALPPVVKTMIGLRRDARSLRLSPYLVREGRTIAWPDWVAAYLNTLASMTVQEVRSYQYESNRRGL